MSWRTLSSWRTPSPHQTQDPSFLAMTGPKRSRACAWTDSGAEGSVTGVGVGGLSSLLKKEGSKQDPPEGHGGVHKWGDFAPPLEGPGLSQEVPGPHVSCSPALRWGLDTPDPVREASRRPLALAPPHPCLPALPLQGHICCWES